MRLKHLSVTLSILVSLSAAAWGGTSDFKVDPAWSHVEFSVSNFAVNTVEGRFKVFSGTISYDSSDATKSVAAVSVQIASVDTGNKKRDAHLQQAEFFEASRFPEMTFKSERIEKKGDRYVMTGPLTIKGRTKNVDLLFTYDLKWKENGTSTLTAEARGTIDRHDFGIDYGNNFSVGRLVQIIIHVQAIP